MMKTTLTIEITYNGADATEKNVERVMDYLVDHAANNGLLADDMVDMTVESWEHRVVTDSVPEPRFDEDENGPRFWVVDGPPGRESEYGIVDEVRGGVIAYALSEGVANTIVQALASHVSTR